MNSYIQVIQSALLWFPFIAFLFTTPYMLYSYHKYGSFFSLRVAIIYSFILYLMCTYFLVILPLPDIEEVAKLTTPQMQLIPFQFVQDILNYSPFAWNDPSSYIKALFSPVVYQMLFNIAMTIPFGMYLRYYFKCSFTKTLLLSFLLSSFFELTQLSGLYGIYPRSYRLFDVDDLMTNTLGGIIGYGGVYPFMKLLPSREKIDAAAYERAKHISLVRRLLAFFLDYGFILLLYAIFACLCFLFSQPLSHGFTILFIAYFLLVPLILDGRTLGKGFMHIGIYDQDGGKAKKRQLLLRHMLFLSFFFIQFSLPGFLQDAYQHDLLSINMYALANAGNLALFLFLDIRFLYLMSHQKPLFYERICHTKLISTILYIEKKQEPSEARESKLEETLPDSLSKD